ncbi:hypothetical protein K5549_005037 [Capra hircus]|nr:hypothetical protein K5549_005037 [Capra hircus]
MGAVCLCLLAAVASPAPTLPGHWPRLRWCGWTAETAPVSTGPWRAPPTSVQPLGLGQPGATALLPVVGAPPNDIGAARRAPGGHCARPRTQSNSRTVTCSPALSAHPARCSVPALSRARASVRICSLAPSACRNPAGLAVTVPEGSCCTTARVCPLPSAPAPSSLCPGASP